MITIDKQQQDVREYKKRKRIKSWQELYAELERSNSYQTRVVHHDRRERRVSK
jgi:hypothetical protein